MNQARRIAWIVAIVLMAGCSEPSPRTPQEVKPGAVGLSPDRLARITPVLQRHVDEGRMAGVVGLVARRGEIAYFEAVGNRDRESKTPMTTDTIVAIASMTKPITSVAVMSLYEEGRFLLTDPASKYLPDLAGMEVGVEEVDPKTGDVVLTRVPAQREMTIQDLLQHTSGLTYGAFGNSAVDKLYAAMPSPTGSLAEFVRALRTLPLKHQPGSAWEYSWSADVLGCLVEVVSGKPFDEFLEERVFRPLGMTDTGFWVPEGKQERLATMYTPGEGGGIRPFPRRDYTKKPALFSGGGGLVTTAGDYFRFAQMLLNGGELDGVRILGRKTVEWMTEDHLGKLPGPPFFPGYGFGIGVGVRREVGPPGGPGSLGQYQWPGASGTAFWVDPREELIGIFMTQLQPGWKRYGDEFEVLAYQAIVD